MTDMMTDPYDTRTGVGPSVRQLVVAGEVGSEVLVGRVHRCWRILVRTERVRAHGAPETQAGGLRDLRPYEKGTFSSISSPTVLKPFAYLTL